MPTTDLPDAVQDLSELLGRRLIVTDERMRVVAYSIHESSRDRERLSVVLAHSDAWPVPPAGSGELTRDLAGVGRLLFVPLRDHRHRVGFLLLALDRDETGLSPATAGTLAGHVGELGLMLSLRTLYAERDRSRVRALLADLIGRDRAARETAAAALVAEGLVGSAGQYTAVAVGPDPGHHERRGGEPPLPAHGPTQAPAQADALAQLAVEATLEFVGRTSTASVTGAGIGGGLGILVFPRPVVADRLARILDRAEFAAMRAGLGPLVTDLSDLHRSFARAQDAWRVGCATDAEARVLAWADLGLDRLLVRLPLGDLTLDDLPAPVGRLLTGGLGADLVGTLSAYLAHGGDAAATARALHIHRSTLYYRLDRVRAVAQVDLADGKARRELHTGLRIAELAGLVQR